MLRRGRDGSGVHLEKEKYFLFLLSHPFLYPSLPLGWIKRLLAEKYTNQRMNKNNTSSYTYMQMGITHELSRPPTNMPLKRYS